MPTNVKTHCIALAVKRGDLKMACKLALFASIENGNSVYLPNAYAMVAADVTKRQWAAYLSMLAQDGVYEASQDQEFVGFWGYISKHEGA